MSRSIPDKLRLLVAERAGFACEYCLVGQDDLILAVRLITLLVLSMAEKPLLKTWHAVACLAMSAKEAM